MRIVLEPYNPSWPQTFHDLQSDLLSRLAFLDPVVEHIGSTSVEGLSAKPVIDILVGLQSDAGLDRTVEPMCAGGYTYYEKYNDAMPYRRLFVKQRESDTEHNLPSVIRKGEAVPEALKGHAQRLAHVHILRHGSEHWVRHIAFRDYLRTHATVKNAYQALKETLSLKEWEDGNAWNAAKDAFIKETERAAVTWYNKHEASGSGSRHFPRF